jgi:hypothetical protein
LTLARAGDAAEADDPAGTAAAPGWLETGFLAVLTSVTLSMIAGTLLAVTGAFSIWALLAALLGYCAVAGAVRVWLRAALPRPDLAALELTAGVAVPLVVVVVAALVLLRPFENVLLLQDPSVYLDSGINISKTGRAELHDDLYHSLTQPTQDAFAYTERTSDGYMTQFRLRGFIVDAKRDQTVPQFFQMPSAWIAAFDDMLGTRGALYAIPLLAVLAVAAVYATARRLFGTWAAAIAAAVLLADAAEVWWGRNHDSDVVYQLLLFGGIFAWCRYEATRRTEVAAVAGLLLGAIAFTRVDAFLVLGPLAVFAVWQALRGRWDRGLAAAALTLVPLTVLAAILAVTFERAYTVFQYHAFNTGVRPYLYVAAIGAIAIAAPVVFLRPRRVLDAIRTRDLTPALWCAAAAIVVAALLAYFVRPLFAPSVPGYPIEQAIRGAKDESLVRLGWYLSLPGLAAAVAGLAVIIITRPTRPVALFLLLVLAPTLFYLQNPRVSADQIWASRRFVAATIPAAAIATGFLLSEAAGFGRWRPKTDSWRYGGQAFAAIAGIAILALTLRPTLPILRHNEQSGAIDQVRAASETMPQDAIVILSPSLGAGLIAPPMKLLHGRDTFVEVITTPPAAVEELVRAASAQNRPAYWVAIEDGKPKAAPKDAFTVAPFTYTKTATFTIDVPILELRFDGIPDSGTRLQSTGTVYKISAAQ